MTVSALVICPDQAFSHECVTYHLVIITSKIMRLHLPFLDDVKQTSL